MNSLDRSSSLSTVRKAIDVLFHLHRSGHASGVSEIARELGLAKTSAHRLLHTLAQRGLLEQDEHARYRPGIALVALGLGVLEREPLAALAREELAAEARELGETVFLTVPRAGAMVVLDKAEGEGFLRAAPRVGSSVPIHATAVGKLALAFDALRLDAASAPPERFTSRTPDEYALRSEVERARVRGFAENHGEWIDGLSVVAAPILVRQPALRFVGAIAVAASTPRMLSLGVERVAARTVAAAARISQRLSAAEAPAAPRRSSA